MNQPFPSAVDTLRRVSFVLLFASATAACSSPTGELDSAKPATTELPAAAVDARGVDYPNTRWLAAPPARHSVPIIKGKHGTVTPLGTPHTSGPAGPATSASVEAVGGGSPEPDQEPEP